jgi:signal transduction histidine kinase
VCQKKDVHMNGQTSSNRPASESRWFSTSFKRINGWLFKPSSQITEPGERKQAELIAALTLFFASLTFVGAVVSFMQTDRNVFAVALLVTLTIVNLTGYAISRTRQHRISGIIILGIWTVVTIAYAYSGRTNNGPLFALVLLLPFGFILGTAVLPLRSLALIVIVSLVGVFLLPVIYPDIGRPFITSAGVLVCMGGLTLIAQRHRDEVERERLRVLSETNIELQTLQADLQQANEMLENRIVEHETLIRELGLKNAELERFTYTVSHDLKSPLITIRGFLGFIEQDTQSGNINRLKGDIQRISDATDKMQRLLNELLEISRIGRVRNEPKLIPFEELARQAVELVQGRIMERGIEVHIDSNMPTVFGDSQRLLEVLQNLVDNAAKFMGDQPNPRIEIGARSARGENAERGEPVFYVKDNGIGIAPEHHERVFGLFNQLDPKIEGTGVGLTLVKRIVEFHGGRIWVESEAGKGATFCFTLPVPQTNKPI